MKHILRPDYTSTGSEYQLVIPMDIGEIIPADDSVRLLNGVLERMDYSKLYMRTPGLGESRSQRKVYSNIVYGCMNSVYASRKLEQACLRDINFMYLLGRSKAPDHATIARFRSDRLTYAVEDLFSQLIQMLKDMGELSLCSVFIDGTKWRPTQIVVH